MLINAIIGSIQMLPTSIIFVLSIYALPIYEHANNAEVLINAGISGNNLPEKKTVKVLSAKKIMDSSSVYFKKDASMCNKWSLTMADIQKILIESEEISGHEAHYFYEILPCRYEGNAIINGKKAVYTINAGSLSEVKTADTTIFYGFKKKKFDRYFLSGPMPPPDKSSSPY